MVNTRLGVARIAKSNRFSLAKPEAGTSYTSPVSRRSRKPRRIQQDALHCFTRRSCVIGHPDFRVDRCKSLANENLHSTNLPPATPQLMPIAVQEFPDGISPKASSRCHYPLGQRLLMLALILLQMKPKAATLRLISSNTSQNTQPDHKESPGSTR